VPTHDRFGLDDQYRIPPARPRRSQERPEEPIERAQWRPWPSPFQNGQLLAKGEDFESDITTGSEEEAGRANQGQEKRNHGIIVHDRAPQRPPRVTASS
jgi:hypothetical protein